MRTEVGASHVRVTPGRPTTFEIAVTNTSDVIDGITATIEGLDPAWVQLVQPVVSLFPQSSATLTLRLDLPTDCLAGDYLVSAKVTSIIDPTRESTHQFWLAVEPVHRATLDMRPRLVVGGAEGRFGAVLANTGNAPVDLTLTAVDPSRTLTCRTEPAVVSLLAGEVRTAEVVVAGKRPWFGNPVTSIVTVTATDGEELELAGTAQFTQKPRIPRGLITILILAGIVALWATIFLLVVDLLRNSDPPTKVLATDFPPVAVDGVAPGAASGAAGAGADVDLAAIGATMTGTVTATTNGEPLPRITVDALRVRADGSLDPVGSAATDDDGAFELESLLPGTYKVRFTAEGFDELWFPAATDASGAEEVRLEPSGEGAVEVALTGRPGSMTGEIVTPESTTSAASATVTVVQVVENPVEGEPLPEPTVVPATNTYSLSGLATPATYRIRIESPGFDPVEFDETLGPGQAKVVNTVTLGAAPGTITGTAVDAAGTPLGNVEVTVRGGELESATKTPTSGSVGQFVLDGLPTPATYVLTFTLDGYDSQTIALDLGPGEARTVSATLIGGTGNVSGIVADADGRRLGGVAVLVRRNELTAETATLTGGPESPQTGSYTVTDLPTPGTYTLTFSLDGYVSETLVVTLDSAGSLAGVDVTMRSSSGAIAGTVRGGGQPLGGATVTLTRGDEPRTTETATNPPGGYLFADVAPGTYSLTVSHPGYASRTVIVEITEGAIVSRDVDLPPG